MHESKKLMGFQRRFVRAATAPGTDTAVASWPRGCGKSFLAAHLIARALTPGDRLFDEEGEVVLVAGSLEQARITYRMARSTLEPTGAYKFADSATRIGIRHRRSNARLRVIGSSGRGAMGLGVDNPLIVGDEPGSWKTTDGELLADALLTAQGKPGQRMKAVLIGTLAPARRGWWHSMVEGGSKGSRHVTALQGDPRKWDRWQEIRRVNPLCNIDAGFRRKLLEERDEARADSRLKARFLSYRLNLPTSDSSEVLLTAEDWELVRARELPRRGGQPVGIDLGCAVAAITSFSITTYVGCPF